MPEVQINNGNGDKEMDTSTLNEIKSAIKYMDYKPAFLSKFCDIKSLLFKEIAENPEEYKVDGIMPNPGNDNKIVKCINILDKKYMSKKEIVDCTKTPASLPHEASDILKSISTKEEGASVRLSFAKEFKAGLYMNIPRGNSFTISNMSFDENVWLELINSYNTYYTEGFTLALHLEDMAISIEPSALEGIKGQGNVFVYVMTDEALYKDLGSKYFDVSTILKYYRG